MGTDKLSFERDRGGSDHCAVLTRRGPVRKSRDFSTLLFFPYFPVLFFPVLFFRTFFSVLFQIIFSHTFFPPYYFKLFFPVLFFFVLFPRTFFFLYFFSPYYFPVLFPMSRRLKSNVLKYQLVVFLEHVVIAQFMFLAEYPFKRHP
jgi:hypothetical protein